ncbi:flagellar basal-body rod protein FlgF/flagellar basal-body rod protein FlgG [Mariprofundus aestuarium]|uniref:Flagellar basal-body rod protein FlgF/flagellar basal-body rod protein FlgG n=1 Tax=Mariprofundus aestuarium TaxID=1921086 RepID=A0A2K8KV21_MARES|nr:flagellar hook basal-body protein [Mariprofundus aestuarium]ATX78610.1 flagellar basal-body rod protein FlgF/flagellar basal-body rod protein FlgG [Mariprofundus aestuarium]
MQSGFYLSGVASQMTQHKLNDINHNLANVNTVGFMASRSSFSSTLAEQMTGQTDPASASYASYENSFVDMKEGAIKPTGNDLDFAIQGGGFFKVRLDDGQEAYTRAGNFMLGANGSLLTRGGHPVLNAGGSEIQLPQGKVSVSQDGTLSVNNIPVTAFGMVTIKDASQLTRLGNALMATPLDNTAPAESDAIVRQGAVAGSNVNSILEMTEMVSTTRNFEATMKVIEQYSQQASQLNDRVGMVQG